MCDFCFFSLSFSLFPFFRSSFNSQAMSDEERAKVFRDLKHMVTCDDHPTIMTLSSDEYAQLVTCDCHGREHHDQKQPASKFLHRTRKRIFVWFGCCGAYRE